MATLLGQFRSKVSRRSLLRTATFALGGLVVPASGAEREPRFLLEWGGRGRGPGEFDAPIGIAVDRLDQVYVTDFKNQRVQKFGPNGTFLAAFSVSAQPGGLAVDGEGQVYVAHWSLGKVAVYSPTGQPVREWGAPGTGEGQFRLPGGIAVAPDGPVYVADQGNSRIQRFTPEGKLLLQWGAQGEGPGRFGAGRAPGSRFAGPQFVAVDREGHVYTTDTVNGKVQKFSAEGRPLAIWGSNDAAPGGFGNVPATPIMGPIALCADREGRIWVSATNHRVQRYSPDGRYLGGFGGEGSGPGQFRTPHGLAVDSRGDLYVVDSVNERVQKFTFAG